MMTSDELKALVRTIADFPKPGIQFRDITTLIGHGEGFAASVHHLAAMARDRGAHAHVLPLRIARAHGGDKLHIPSSQAAIPHHGEVIGFLSHPWKYLCGFKKK